MKIDQIKIRITIINQLKMLKNKSNNNQIKIQ